MKPPDKKKMEEFKKQFQTSNFSANEYMKWKRSGQAEIERLSMGSQSRQDGMGLQIIRKKTERDKDNDDA